MTSRGDLPAGRTTTSGIRARRVVGGAVAAVGTAVVGVVAADFYQGTRESLGAPLSVQVASESSCPAGSFVVPRSALPKRAEPGTVHTGWAYSKGGLDLNPLYYLTVQGDSEESVVLHSLSVVDVNRVSPPPDAVAFRTCVGGGDLYRRRFDLKVGEAGSSVEAVSGDKDEPSDGADPAPKFPYKVSSSDPEVFWLMVKTQCYCEWKLRLKWTSGSRSGSADVTLDGRSFRTGPTSGGPATSFGLTPRGRVVQQDG